jgi:hypothetical protein
VRDVVLFSMNMMGELHLVQHDCKSDDRCNARNTLIAGDWHMKPSNKKKRAAKSEPKTARKTGAKGKIYISDEDPSCPMICMHSGKAAIIIEILDGRPGLKMFDCNGVERLAIYATQEAAVIQLRTSDGRAVNHVIR